jgi:hypothetical protein
VRRNATLLSVLLIPWAANAAAQQVWNTYVDPSFGTSIAYPADLFGAPSPTDNGVIFAAGSTVLEVSAIYRPDLTTPSAVRSFMLGLPEYQQVTYSPEGNGWLVVSGYRGEDIFYEKYFLVGGTVQGFSLQYPVAERAFFDPLVEVIEDSFRAGPT